MVSDQQGYLQDIEFCGFPTASEVTLKYRGKLIRSIDYDLLL